MSAFSVFHVSHFLVTTSLVKALDQFRKQSGADCDYRDHNFSRVYIVCRMSSTNIADLCQIIQSSFSYLLIFLERVWPKAKTALQAA